MIFFFPYFQTSNFDISTIWFFSVQSHHQLTTLLPWLLFCLAPGCASRSRHYRNFSCSFQLRKVEGRIRDFTDIIPLNNKNKKEKTYSTIMFGLKIARYNFFVIFIPHSQAVLCSKITLQTLPFLPTFLLTWLHFSCHGPTTSNSQSLATCPWWNLSAHKASLPPALPAAHCFIDGFFVCLFCLSYTCRLSHFLEEM